MLSSASRVPMPSEPAAFDFPGSIRFGAGAARGLPAALTALGVARPLLVATPGRAASGLVDQVAGPIGPFVLFAELPPDPTDEDVARGAERYRESGCDGLIGLGGGAAIEAAKAMAWGLDLPPTVAIPTTSGPGVEVLPSSRLRSTETGRKREVGRAPRLPSVAICDPRLTLATPPAVTAAAGLDALAHCVESYLAVAFHPLCDGAAIEGLRYIFRGLEAAVQDGASLEARSAMMVGSLLGGTAAHKGLGVAHALAFAVELDAPGRHAALVALLLPHALRFIREAAEPRMAELATRVGLGRAGDGPGHLITLVELLRANAPLPRRLRDVEGLARDRFPEYARLALLDPSLAASPRPCTPALLEELLDRAW